ncbi:MAG TPA: hypothetical protein VHY32_01845 [Caulobacteraceae bacterium]|jgi:predicted GH43/DUF377 family glycosyl hydrolase|nr:hypothetical protein [Caulobacteraceae bacterium]
MAPFQLERMGVIMEPEKGEPNEVEGVLNPAIVRGKDGQLYMFPRLVGAGNYSRIGMARVLFDTSGDPCGVERMGVALAPEADYELREGGGGCEDPRVTYLEPLGHYVMTYTALSSRGPRIAIAISDDLFEWRRVGVARFHAYKGLSFEGIDNKDASIFPMLIASHMGRPAVAMLHRPLFPRTRPEEKADPDVPAPHAEYMENIWISYHHIDEHADGRRSHQFIGHHELAAPAADWEQLKIGGGAPPMMCRHGWLMIYHGVHETAKAPGGRRKLCYSAGAMVLSPEHPTKILYRSAEPVMAPQTEAELHGTVDAVVFPTGLDRRDDLNDPDRFDVYYGMADDRIGVARLRVPAELPMMGRRLAQAAAAMPPPD